jgi:hypothetical protein
MSICASEREARRDATNEEVLHSTADLKLGMLTVMGSSPDIIKSEKLNTNFAGVKSVES